MNKKKSVLLVSSLALASVPFVVYAESENGIELNKINPMEIQEEKSLTIQKMKSRVDNESYVRTTSDSVEIMTPEEIDEFFKSLDDDYNFVIDGVKMKYHHKTRQISILGTERASYNTLEIPVKVGSTPVTKIVDFAFEKVMINQLTIGASVTYIGDYAFAGTGLRMLKMGNRVDYIGSYAFSLTELTSVNIPSSVKEIGRNAFSESKLTSVSLGTGVIDIPEQAFANNALTNVQIPPSVRTVGEGAFTNNKINNLVLTRGLNSIGDNAFSDNRLKNIYIPETVDLIGSLAYHNNPVKSIIIPERLKFYVNQITNDPSKLDFLNIYAEGKDPGSSYTGPDEDEDEKSETENGDLKALIKQGSFGLVKPDFKSNSFGTFDLGKNQTQKEMKFKSDVYVVDMTGAGTGWSLTVETTQFEQVKPRGGGEMPKGGWLKLPKGSLSLTGVGKAYKIDSDGDETPTSLTTTTTDAVVDSGPVTLMKADPKNAFGAFGLDMSDAKLVLNLDTATTLVDTVNYPDKPTPYSTTVTWTLTAGPGN